MVAPFEPRVAINLTNTPGDADSLFKITQRGSYYLTDNITGAVGKHGIEIAANGVTIDLMGFDLLGAPAMGAFDGVSATVLNLTNITIRNGSVRAWGDEGVDLGTFSSINSAVIDVRASNNSGNGITIGRDSTISGCSARANTGNGITASSGCTITGCTAFSNTGNGIVTSAGSTISNCTVQFNNLDGIRVSSECTVFANTSSFNGIGSGDGAGIHATGSDNRIEGNNCTRSDRGIDVDGFGNIIIKNTCSGNTSNWEIAVGNVCLVILATPTVAAISGDSGGLSPGSTNPNANFSY